MNLDTVDWRKKEIELLNSINCELNFWNKIQNVRIQYTRLNNFTFTIFRRKLYDTYGITIFPDPGYRQIFHNDLKDLSIDNLKSIIIPHIIILNKF